MAGELVAGRRKLEAAGEHRVAGDPVALEVDQQELPASPDLDDALSDEGRHLGRRAAHGERSGRLGGPYGTAREGSVEGVGDHGQIGQFGHGAAIVAFRRRVLDSPGPKRADS